MPDEEELVAIPEQTDELSEDDDLDDDEIEIEEEEEEEEEEDEDEESVEEQQPPAPSSPVSKPVFKPVRNIGDGSYVVEFHYNGQNYAWSGSANSPMSAMQLAWLTYFG
ncbi:Uncharacterised protein [Shigella sonnei]|nr:Uncharacterised protein [Shigella sonnei]